MRLLFPHGSPVRFVVVIAAIALMAVGWYWMNRRRSAESEAPLSPIPLTSYPGTENTPSFSPDGTQVAFEWCTEEPGGNCDIYIKQIGVEPPFRLTSDPANDFSPAWSPDANFIAFIRQLSPTRAALLIIPQRGGQERVLGETDLSNLALAWTPDSKWLVLPWVEAGKADPGLFLLSVQTGEKRRLTSGRDTLPAFSPDGRTLAFTQESTDIYLLHLGDGYLPQGAPERLQSVGDENVALTWTTDGNELVLSHGIWASSGLWRMAASASASPRRLPFGSENSCCPAVSRQGNRLAYAVYKQDSNIWSIDLSKPGLNPGVPVSLISSTRQEECPAYSPDGKKIAFFSDRSGAYEVWVCNSDGSNPVQLTSYGGIDNGPRWSPDGRSIAMTVFDGRYQFIYVISANGGIPRRLTSDPAVVDKWPYWSRDGQWIYFSRGGLALGPTVNQIWKLPATGGKAVQITPNGEWRDMPQESPDGKFLYYKKYDKGNSSCSVWRMPVGGGEEARVLDSVHLPGGYRVWEQGIYFFRSPDERGRSDICLYEFATGKTKKILTIEGRVGFYMEVSPNGRTILYNQVDQVGSDLMLVENFR